MSTYSKWYITNETMVGWLDKNQNEEQFYKRFTVTNTNLRRDDGGFEFRILIQGYRIVFLIDLCKT